MGDVDEFRRAMRDLKKGEWIMIPVGLTVEQSQPPDPRNLLAMATNLLGTVNMDDFRGYPPDTLLVETITLDPTETITTVRLVCNADGWRGYRPEHFPIVRDIIYSIDDRLAKLGSHADEPQFRPAAE